MSSSIRHKLRHNSRDSYGEEEADSYAENHPSPKNHPTLGGYGNNMLQKKKDDQQQQQQQQQSQLWQQPSKPPRLSATQSLTRWHRST